jgi:hypothetical protein
MKHLLPLLLLACLASFAQDLNDYSQYSAGTITAANAACTATACVYLAMPLNASAATAVLSGTFSATVQFEASVDGLVWNSIGVGSATWNSIGVGSATSAGSYTFSLTGQRVIRARCSAFTSGSMGVSWGATVGASGGGGVSTAAQVVNLFTGCSGTQYLGADGACHTASGGAGSNAAYTTVTYSATPTFTVTASSTPQIFKITLTGNVTSSTLATSSATAGQQIGLQIVQGSGPYTFAYPSNFIGATPISTANGVLTTCIGVFDGTNVTNPVCTTNDAWHGINLTATVFSTLRSDVSTGSTAWICDNTVTALGTAVTSGSGTCGTGSAIAQLLFNGSGWTLAALGAEANASGWTDNGTTIAAASGRTVTVGTTNPIVIGGATGSCAGAYAKADGTGCGTPSGGGAVSSVFTRTGAVTAQSGDYTATQVGLGNVTNDVQTKNSLIPNSFAGFRFGNSGSADTAGTAANVVSLFSTCSGTQYLGADGACHNSSSLSLGNAIGGSPTANAILYGDGSGNLQNAAGITRTGSAQLTLGVSGSPGNEIVLGTTATDSASLGTELTTSGTCSGTGWTGTYPNYVAPGTTAPLTCTGFTSGSLYQTVTSIGAGGSGSVTIAIGTAQVASGSSGTVTAGLKANGTSLTYTPAATYTGTIGISAKLITPISMFSYTGKDSTGAVSFLALYQGLASLHNTFSGGGGSYNTTGSNNTGSGYQSLYSNTTGGNNTGSGYQSLYSNTTGGSNTGSGYQSLYSNTTGGSNSAQGAYALSNNTTGSNNTGSGYQSLNSNTTGGNNTGSGYQSLNSNTTGGSNTGSGYESLSSNTTGSNNTGFGYQSGRYIANGSTANQTSSNSVYLGYDTYANANGDTNENVVGNSAIGAGSNTTVLGNASVTDTWMGGSAGASNHHAKDFVPSSAAPGISGCSSATIVGNDHFGVITAGGTSCNAVLTFSYSALHGWSCSVNNQTHPGATNIVGQASTAANSATFAGVTVTSDVLNYVCGPY